MTLTNEEWEAEAIRRCTNIPKDCFKLREWKVILDFIETAKE